MKKRKMLEIVALSFVLAKPKCKKENPENRPWVQIENPPFVNSQETLKFSFFCPGNSIINHCRTK